MDISSRNIIISGDFHVVIQQGIIIPIADAIMYDTSGCNFEGRSVYGNTLAGSTNPCCGVEGSHNFTMQAVIDPIAKLPVGGVVYGVDRLAVLAPWLVVIALVGCIVTVAVVTYVIARRGKVSGLVRGFFPQPVAGRRRWEFFCVCGSRDVNVAI